MSLGAGALTLRRLRVLAEPEQVRFHTILEKLSHNMVQPIGIDEPREQSAGWCHPFTGDPTFGDPNDLVYEDAFVFGMRTDSKKIPGTLFRLQMKAALESLTRQSSDIGETGKKRVPKRLKDAARDRIKLELLRHTLPSIRLVEIVWHLETHEIWMTSASKAVMDEFEKLFEETFHLPLVHLNPGTGALDFSRLSQDSEYSLEKLYNLVPADLLQARHLVELPREVEVSLPAPF